MPEIELDAGVIEYEDSRGDGPVLVLIGGLAMDWRLWQGVIEGLGADYRCIAPNMPLGSHRKPMNPDADLSLVGMGRIVADLLERLDLRDVTLVFNDWGGAQTMVSHDLVDRVGRLALVSCEAFENYPPGLAGKAAGLSARMPGGLSLMRQSILRRPLRRLPFIYGQMSKRGVPTICCAAGSSRCGERRSGGTCASTSATSGTGGGRCSPRRPPWRGSSVPS